MDANAITGHLILIMGPMGSGKGSIVTFLLRQFPQLQYSISCTTRQKRPGETNGKEYHFITRETFQHRIDQDAFLEYAEFSGNLYGTLKSEVADRLCQGQVLITEIELQGVQQLVELIPKAHRTLVFIDAGDWEVLKARALARAPMTDDDLHRRHERYLQEMQSKPYADVIIDNTDGKLEEANEHMIQLVETIFARTSQHEQI